jgi:hypothetical protein
MEPFSTEMTGADFQTPDYPLLPVPIHYFVPSGPGYIVAHSIHDVIPVDAVEITKEQHEAMLKQVADDPDLDLAADATGQPVLRERQYTQEELSRRIRYMARAHLNDEAIKAGYQNLDDVISYAEESAVAQYQADGKAFRKWRSLVKAAVDDLVKARARDDLNALRKDPEALVQALPPLERS